MPTSLEAVVAQARGLYAEGRSRTEVARAVYGVDLPAEFFVIVDAVVADSAALPLYVLCHPWEVCRLADPAREPYLRDVAGQRLVDDAAAQHPEIVLLMELCLSDAVHGDSFVGYDVRELRAGRSTVVGFEGDVPAQGATYSVLGPSLLHVLAEMTADNLRMMRARATVWENIRYGTPDQDIEAAVELTRRVEELRLRVVALP